MSAPALRASGLGFSYGPRTGFSLSVPALALAAGERCALIGPSGSGKSTLLHLLAGILVPSSGTVELAGAPLSAKTESERRARRVAEIGLVFQEFELLEYLNAEDNVLLPYRLAGHLRLDAAARARAAELAAAAGIGELLRRHPRTLSQGQRQRVGLCRALVTQPAVVLADEPTGNLDPAAAERVRELLFTSCADQGAGLLVVTHDRAHLDSYDTVFDMSDWSIAR